MNLFDRIKELAAKQGKSINDVEEDMGYSKNTLYRLKRTNPSSEKLRELADHFGVSTDYLLGREEQTKKDPLTYYRMDTSGMTEDQIKILREKLEFAERLAREDIRRAKGE